MFSIVVLKSLRGRRSNEMVRETIMNFLQKLWHWGLCSNYYSWFHGITGGILAKVGLLVCTPLRSLLYVALIALAWEVVEFFVECKGRWNIIIDIYGSKERWLYDSLGDVLIAIAMAGIVVC